MNKKIIIFIGIIIILIIGIFLWKKSSLNKRPQEQLVLEKTLNISREYVALRYTTDNILVNAKNYSDYESWNKEMTGIIEAWKNLEKKAVDLEKSATEMSENKITFNLISPVFAYNKQEISDVFDKAPAGKKIATLAKHLGVDAKMAFKILQQDQSQVEADAWNEAGDTFQKLESSAVVIKDTCKVAGFVGGIVMTGGTSALAAGSTLTKMAVIVSGADLTLEVSSDGAKIGLGNNNKISAVIDSARVITEPLSSILTIANIPRNMATGFEKFGVVMVGLEQFNSAAQEGKIIGIQLPAYTKDKIKSPVKVAVLEKEEIEKWIEDQGINNKSETVEEVKKILDVINKIEDVVVENINTGIEGVWKGTMYHTMGQNKEEQQKEVVFTFKSDGTVEASNVEYEFYTYAKIGDVVRLYEEEKTDGYYEFALSGDSMTFIKLAGIDGQGKWSEVMAGEDFLGGKFVQISLKKQ